MILCRYVERQNERKMSSASSVTTLRLKKKPDTCIDCGQHTFLKAKGRCKPCYNAAWKAQKGDSYTSKKKRRRRLEWLTLHTMIDDPLASNQHMHSSHQRNWKSVIVSPRRQRCLKAKQTFESPGKESPRQRIMLVTIRQIIRSHLALPKSAKSAAKRQTHLWKIVALNVSLPARTKAKCKWMDSSRQLSFKKMYELWRRRNSTVS